MTSLLERERYPASTFGALYHQRWRIEEAFKRLKTCGPTLPRHPER
jgi:IS4 transposase